MSVLLQTTFFSPAGLPQITMQLLTRLPMKTCLLNLALGIMLIGLFFFFSVVYHTLCVSRYTLEMSYCSWYSQLFSNLATFLSESVLVFSIDFEL